jgi:outer membrane protein TolC
VVMEKVLPMSPVHLLPMSPVYTPLWQRGTKGGFSRHALVEYQKVREIRAERELLVTSLQDRKRLAYLRYRGGVDTLLNALDADRDLFNAELSLAQIRLSELLSLVQLYRALGGGWQE